jgi:cell division protein ZipA
MDVEFKHSIHSPLAAEPDVLHSDPEPAPTNEPRKATRHAPERIVALRLIPRGDELSSATAVLALRNAGLRHGRYGIFHRVADGQGEDAAFSVASLTEPGSFDLANLADTTIAGMSLFVVLPGNGDPVERFDMMIETARALAVELDAELHDERGSSWSVQRERYVREEIIEYRHQLDRR